MDTRLTAEGLACRRGDRLLFKGLDLALEPGDALHVTGANGIGKSSLLRILAGLLRPFAGEVERTGNIGLLDERPALDPQLPLSEALEFWASLDGTNRQQQAASLDLLRLSALTEVPVRFLSTGQRKRAGMARLMAQGASIWLLDEPLNGLDSDGMEAVCKLIETHAGQGGLCVIASHLPVPVGELKTLALADFLP